MLACARLLSSLYSLVFPRSRYADQGNGTAQQEIRATSEEGVPPDNRRAKMLE